MSTTNNPDPITLVENSGWDPRILVARCGELVDVFVVLSQRYLIVVDTLATPQAVHQLMGLIEQHRAGRQLLVINTHSHWDHAWGNQCFAAPDAAYPAPIIGTRRCAEELLGPEGQATLTKMRDAEPERFGDVRLYAPTVQFDQYLRIDGGDLTLELFDTNGHSPDHIAIFIPEIATLLAGDAAEMPFPLVDTAATLPQLRASLQRMADLNAQVALYCHAPGISDPALITRNIAYFDLLEQRCRAALAQSAPPATDEGSALEEYIGFPFAETVPPDRDANALEGFYRPYHQAAIRAMLEHLAASAKAPML